VDSSRISAVSLFLLFISPTAQPTEKERERLNSNASLSISSLAGKCFAARASIRYAIFLCLVASSQKESNPITFFYEHRAA
jgi:hypothetical protein